MDFMKGADVVFHFNPRFSEQTIVRNSNLSGYWGPEEREGGFPFIQGRQFEVQNTPCVCVFMFTHFLSVKFTKKRRGRTKEKKEITKTMNEKEFIVKRMIEM